MKLKIIACKVIARELSSAAIDCPNTLDVTTIRQNYHNTPKKLNELLQAEIDAIERGDDPHTNGGTDFDAIILGYGLCSNSVVGLKSSKYKLIIPRAHDCITFFLGDRDRYQSVFETYKGTFFYSRSWVEVLPDQGEAQLKRKYEEYMEKFEDEDTVEYLMEMERAMVANYSGAAYISWPGQNEEPWKAVIRKMTEEKGWTYYDLDGSPALLRKMVNGQWDPHDFLIAEPGQTIRASTDGSILKAE